MNTSPNKVTIDLSALKYNLLKIRELVGKETRIMGIVKSDAYGHGLIPIARELEKLQIYSLGVDYISEAIKLRTGGVKTPVVVLLGISTPQESKNVVDYKLTPVIFDLDSARMLSEEGKKSGKTITVFLKIDTGMGRLGIDFQETGLFLKQLMGIKGIKIEGLFSHLSSADQQDNTFTKTQIKNFKDAISVSRKLGIELTMNNLANSAGIMRYKETHFDLVRPGIMLYGGLPCPGFAGPPPLRGVMTFCSSVVQVREVKHGTPISYGRTFYTDGSRKIAIISAGYADGLSRSMSNKGQVLIHGQKTRIIGRICMNLTIADVTPIKGVKRGDRVFFLGMEKGNTITVDDMARWADTISYEVLCSIGSRNKREYINEKKISQDS
ncbi:MAG: alanine racemase [Deltaproteobacteria bacterium]|nr:alanine racemase [Deltaproteobacteria bacterium]